MSEIIQAPESLRDTLTANVEAAETGTLPTAEERARDEVGRFAKKTEVKEVPEVIEDPLQKLRPTTWKKEYLPLWDKAAKGEGLSKEDWRKLAEYNSQRETEYKTGVSTYRAEAENAKHIQEAMTPFLPELQSRGIPPAAWIKDVGQAHYILANGTPDQKVQLLRTLAQQYNVPLQTVQQGGQIPPIVDQLLQKINQLEAKVGSVDGWRNQLDSQAIQSAIEQMQGDTQRYPNFDAVRESMAQLLEKGAATDLPTAYKMAIRLDDSLMEEEITRRLEAKIPKPNIVEQARAKAVSPKSATPSGQVTTSEAKDRRSQLAEAFEAHAGGRV